jgi:phosphate transport system substrate-binding protein
MRRWSRVVLVRVAGLIAVVAMVTAACGSDKNNSSASSSDKNATTTTAAGMNDSATLSGAGSTFVQTIEQEWIKDYKAAAAGVTINYQGVGSGAGVQQLTSKTVDFAGSDVPLKPTEQDATGGAGNVLQIPWIAGGIAVEYNLSGVSNLKLSGEALAGIFAGKITKWNDAAIKADNADVTLPSTGIQVVHRADGSGTTSVFTSYLTAVAPSVWTFGAAKDVPWPTGTGAKGSDGVTAAVKQTAGAIGYSEVSFPKQSSLGIASIKNKSGSFVQPTSDAVSAALGTASVNADLTLKINYQPDDPKAYPVSTTTYVMYYKTMSDTAKAAALKHFVAWVLTEGQKKANDLDYAPMPQSILDKAIAVVNS